MNSLQFGPQNIKSSTVMNTSSCHQRMGTCKANGGIWEIISTAPTSFLSVDRTRKRSIFSSKKFRRCPESAFILLWGELLASEKRSFSDTSSGNFYILREQMRLNSQIQ